MIDVTDATLEAEVLVRSDQVPVVVDLWAPWCEPCKALGPIIERVVAATNGKVILAKINVDENPQAGQMFQVQSIPAVFAVHERKIVNGFVGAQGEAAVQEFVDGLLPTEEQSEVERLIEAGDEASIRAAIELEPGNELAITALAEILVTSDRTDDALALLEKIPESPETRRIAAMARTSGDAGTDDIETTLNGLLDQVKSDDEARQRYVDLLEVMGPDDPRTADYRKKLTSRLF